MIKLKQLSVLFLLIILMQGCRKTDFVERVKNSETNNSIIRATQLDVNNEEMMQMVLTGSGGRIGMSEETEEEVWMPAYVAPKTENGIMAFESYEDFENYTDALDILVANWEYSEDIYEDTPEEIDHLGEEPLNEVDDAFNFNSLRYKYEISDFNDFNWEDTAKIYIEDEDLQNVMNRDHEVKIGDKIYKYLTSEIYAEISNNDYDALQAVRHQGLSAVFLENVAFFDEYSGDYITQSVEGTTSNCDRLVLKLYPMAVTPTPTNNSSWEVRLRVVSTFNYGLFYFGSTDAQIEYTVDWGDGNIETFTFDEPGFFSPTHIYNGNFSPGNSTTYKIQVTAQVINANEGMLERCPDILGETFEASKDFALIVPPDCLSGNHKRKFESQEATINGTVYRMKCKLAQKGALSGLARMSKYKASLSLYKKKSSGKWKKIQPLESMGVRLEGIVYEISCYQSSPCSNVISTLAEQESTRSSKKVKIKKKVDDKCSGTSKHAPDYLKASYYFTYYSNGTVRTVSLDEQTLL